MATSHHERLLALLGIALERSNQTDAKKLWHDVMEDLGLNNKLRLLKLDLESIPVGDMAVLLNWLHKFSIPPHFSGSIRDRILTASGADLTQYSDSESGHGPDHGHHIGVAAQRRITDDDISQIHRKCDSDLNDQQWEYYQGTGMLLHQLYQDVSGFKIPSSMPSFFGDGGAGTVAESAAAIWLVKNCAELVNLVAEKTMTETAKHINPGKLTQDIIEILKVETRYSKKEHQLELLAQLMIRLGVGILGKGTDWDGKLRELFKFQFQSSSGTRHERAVMNWVFGIEVESPDLALEERERSFGNLMADNPSQCENWHLNDWAYLLLRLELWRAATPMAKKEVEMNRWAGSMDTCGWALFFEKDYKTAEKYLQDATSTLAPGTQDWCETKYHLFQTYLWAGNLTEARIVIDELQDKAAGDYWTHKATEHKSMVTEMKETTTGKSSDEYQYQVALSFAGEDRKYADQLARLLTEEGVRVFYDDFERASLWGQDLYRYLSDVYHKKARFCVMFISEYYEKKRWTNLESRAAQARAFQENEPYILPVKIDNTEIPGILPTVAYMSLEKDGIPLIFQTLLSKLNE